MEIQNLYINFRLASEIHHCTLRFDLSTRQWNSSISFRILSRSSRIRLLTSPPLSPKPILSSAMARSSVSFASFSLCIPLGGKESSCSLSMVAGSSTHRSLPSSAMDTARTGCPYARRSVKAATTSAFVPMAAFIRFGSVASASMSKD